jgi:hypothetical protein
LIAKEASLIRRLHEVRNILAGYQHKANHEEEAARLLDDEKSIKEELLSIKYKMIEINSDREQMARTKNETAVNVNADIFKCHRSLTTDAETRHSELTAAHARLLETEPYVPSPEMQREYQDLLATVAIGNAPAEITDRLSTLTKELQDANACASISATQHNATLDGLSRMLAESEADLARLRDRGRKLEAAFYRAHRDRAASLYADLAAQTATALAGVMALETLHSEADPQQPTGAVTMASGRVWLPDLSTGGDILSRESLHREQAGLMRMYRETLSEAIV